MATRCSKDAGKVIIFILCGVLSTYFTSALTMNMANLDHVTTWAKALSIALMKHANGSAAYSVMDTAYNNRDGKLQETDKILLAFEPVNSKDLVSEMASSLGNMLTRKMEALNRSVEAAEDAAAKHTWNPKIEKSSVDYLNTNEIDESLLEYSDRFHQKILANVTSVHIPVEIYDGDVEILNGLQWSAALDDVFAENFKSDPEMLWQYFGSQTGFMRTLPASKWRNGPQDVDLYDVRRRPWYTQGASSPKDMLIVIDTSGSVHGQALELIKVSVKSLLDTLGENDFVNIIKFDKEAEFVSCFETFVQANYRNKKILTDAVDKIKARGQADFQAGLSFAFEQFIKLNNGSQEGRDAGCNRMIMLLTDGGTDYATDIYKKYNPKKNQTQRVFTYAVGPTANPQAAIKWMACHNRGFFSHIPAMGAVRSKVQEYVEVVARPLALGHVKDLHWTSIYTGANSPVEYVPVISRPPAIAYVKEYKWGNIYLDYMGLGMMTTVTLPVYNRTVGTSNQTILGVMGIDVTTKEMLKHEPKRKLGPNGYSYSINSNGYIIFHPNLKLYEHLPDPPNVDFLEVEAEDWENLDREWIRRQMIDMKNDTKLVDTYLLTKDRRHIVHETRSYSFMGIDDTTFSLGVSLPTYQKHYLNVSMDISRFEKSLLKPKFTTLLIADWDYYQNYTSETNLTGTADDLIDALSQPENYKFDDSLINHLLWDINVTSYLDGYWKSHSLSNISAAPIASFIRTIGGLTRVFPTSWDILKQFHDERDPWESDSFKRAMASSLFLFSAPYILTPSKDPNATAPGITVVKSVNMYDIEAVTGGRQTQRPLAYKPAVVGAIFTHQTIQDMMFVLPSVQNFANCNHTEELDCYLLDDGGFLIATNQDNLTSHIGQFFGRLDPEVMWELLNKTSTYNRVVNYDYQATCDTPEDNTTSAGTLSFKIPSINLVYELLTFNWWSAAVTTLMNFNLYNLLFMPSVEQVHAAGPPAKAPRPCIMKEAQYYLEDSFKKVANTTDCTVKWRCQRQYHAARVADTNLLLVVIEKLVDVNGCDKCKQFLDKEDLLQEPVEDEPDFCEVSPRYRKSNYVCYDYDSREDSTKCGCLSCHSAPLAVISLIAVIVTFLNTSPS